MIKRYLFLVLSVLCVIQAGGCENDRLYNEGDILMEGEKWDKAIERFDLQLEVTPAGKVADAARQKIRECYQSWIRDQLKYKKYDNALQLMRLLIDRFPGSEEAVWAEGQRPKTHFEAAKKLVENGVVPEGSRRLREFLALYPDDTLAGEAKELLDGIGIIAFVVDEGIWISKSDGTEPRQVVDKGIQPDLSSDGKQITYIQPANPGSVEGRLYSCNISGNRKRRLRKSPIAFKPKWSFDSRRIAVSKSDFFQILDLKTDKVSTIRPKELGYHGEFDSFGDWSQDGNTLICYLNESTDGNYYICRVDNNLTNAFRLSTEKSPIRDLDWSSDDKVIAFSNADGLFIMDSKGGNRKTLIDRKEMDLDVYCLSWAPSGKSILFVAKDKEGTGSLYIINIDREVYPVLFPQTANITIQPLGCSWVNGSLPSE